jgi:DHA1 family multidrug resistance protein-like MFS transporter
MTVCGCFSALLMPMPFIFYFFGKRIRAKSKFAPAPDLQQDKRRLDEEAGATVGEKENEAAEAPALTSSDESTSEKKSEGATRNASQ